MNTIVLRKMINFPNVLWNWLLLKRKGAFWGKRLTVFGRLIVHGQGRFVIGDDVTLVSDVMINPSAGGSKCAFSFVNNGKITIGNRVGISLSYISAAESVTIEDDVIIGADCMIADNDFHPLNAKERILHQNEHIKTSPVLIQQGAFLGARCIVLKGVTIGKNAVIGAGAVVTRDVPANQIWAGNPAKFIRECPGK